MQHAVSIGFHATEDADHGDMAADLHCLDQLLQGGRRARKAISREAAGPR